MEGIKGWVVSISAAALISAVINVLGSYLPSEKTVKFATGIFVLLSFVIPFSDFDFSADGYTDGISKMIENHELERKTLEQTAQILEEQIESETGAYIGSLGEAFTYISARVFISSTKEICVDSVEIGMKYISDEDRDSLSEYVSERFGVAAEIVITEYDDE